MAKWKGRAIADARRGVNSKSSGPSQPPYKFYSRGEILRSSQGYEPSWLPASRRRRKASTGLVPSPQWCLFLLLVPCSLETSRVSTTVRKVHPTNMNGLELDRQDDLPIPYQNPNESEKYAYNQASDPQASQIPLASELCPPSRRFCGLRTTTFAFSTALAVVAVLAIVAAWSWRLAGCEERALVCDFTHLLNRISADQVSCATTLARLIPSSMPQDSSNSSCPSIANSTSPATNSTVCVPRTSGYDK